VVSWFALIGNPKTTIERVRASKDSIKNSHWLLTTDYGHVFFVSELQFIEPLVLSALGQQLCVRALFDNPATLHDHD
jgi:hypothetical protein